MSWLDEIHKNNPLKHCQKNLKIPACAQNTVKERAVVCDDVPTRSIKSLFNPLQFDEKNSEHISRAKKFHDFKFLTVFFNDLQCDIDREALKTKPKI
jgi:hypothetical protein